MGLVPLLMPRNAAQALAYHGASWQHEMRGRHSCFGWRRRRAYSACCALIRAREAALGMRPDPWVAPAPSRYPPMPPDDAEQGGRQGGGRPAPAEPPPDIETRHRPTHHNTGKRAAG